MSTPSELAAAIQAATETVRAVSEDPSDQIQMLVALARGEAPVAAGGDVVGAAVTAMHAATVALYRRAALSSLARAAASAQPRSYDEAVALRDLVCGLLDDGITEAGDMGDDAATQALRALKSAVADGLTRLAGNLTRLQMVQVQAPLPALVHAYRLYEDMARSDEVAAYADASDPNALPTQFRALGV